MENTVNENAQIVAKKPLWKKILNIVFDVLVGLIVIVGLGVGIISITARANNNIPSVFGKSVLVVQTESMTGTIDKGDIIFIDQFAESGTAREDALVSLQPDVSIVTFYFDINTDGTKELVTHKFIQTLEIGGYTYYQFQGTYKEHESDTLATQEVRSDDILGTYTGSRIPKIGTFLDFLRTPLGFGLIIILPVFAFFLYSLIKLILALMENKKPKKVVASVSEEEKERIKEELRKELLAEQEKDSNKEND